LYKRYAVQLLAIAVNKTGDKETAQELVQESFINLYQHKASLAESTSIKAYLYVILKNKIINQYRQELLKQRYSDYVTHQSPSDELSPLVYVETRELEIQLKQAIEQLPSQCRTVFKLSREQYLSDKEIAAEMDISVNTVEQHKRKALRLLRGSLKCVLGFAVISYFVGN
jgi:RNA polymerase sigma-70 factor (family 1)